MPGKNRLSFPSGKKWVFFRLSSLGDIVLATGVLDYLALEHNLDISVVTRTAFMPVFENNPHIKNVYGISEPELVKSAWKTTCLKIIRTFPEHGLVDLHGSLRSMKLRRLWPGDVLSYPKLNLKRRLYRYMKDPWSGKVLRAMNVPQRYFSAFTTPPAAKLLRPNIYLRPKEMDFARKTINQLAIKPPFVCIHPYATHKAKAWPADKWTDFIALLDKKGVDWLILGQNPSRLIDDNPRDLTSRTSLRETSALIAQSCHLVTADSGPMHVGTAVKTPVTALFGPTSREWGFFPSGEKDTAIHLNKPCSPCTLHGRATCRRGLQCMNDITPQMVMRSIEKTL